jgi:aspartyl-tRNA(Asn)/glutamyl-tRNA(Gln) amidotransferase subunit A
VVGYKPTARRVPNEGVLPLSTSLDSVGPLANSVACCAAVDAVLAGEAPRALLARDLAGVRLALPDRLVTDDMDAATSAAFDRALAALSAAGARVERVHFRAMSRIGGTTARTSLAASEAFAWHRNLLARGGARYDRRVRIRIEGGSEADAADYIEALAARRAIGAEMARATAPFDAVVMPAVPLAPAPIADLEEDDAVYSRINGLMLRNTALANYLDRCAISLPCHRPGAPPAGLMLVGETSGDHGLFSLAAGVETVLASAG